MGWMYRVKRVLVARGMSVEQERVVMHDRNEWIAAVMHKCNRLENLQFIRSNQLFGSGARRGSGLCCLS